MAQIEGTLRAKRNIYWRHFALIFHRDLSLYIYFSIKALNQLKDAVKLKLSLKKHLFFLVKKDNRVKTLERKFNTWLRYGGS